LIKIPMALNIPLLPPSMNRYRHVPLVPSAADQWGTTALPGDVLSQEWSIDWANWDWWHLWQKVPGDLGWIIEHEYGFLGEVRPLAYGTNDALVEVGGLQCVVNLKRVCTDSGCDLRVLNSGTQLRDLMTINPPSNNSMFPAEWVLGQGTMLDLAAQFKGFLATERCDGKNRWAAQKARGGRPHEVLLAK
jgi:hypothetical protein